MCVKHHHTIPTEFLCQAAPTVVTRTVARWCLEARSGCPVKECIAERQELGAELLCHSCRRLMCQPTEHTQCRYHAPSRCAHPTRLILLGIVRILFVPRQEIKLGSSPEPFVVRITVAVRSRADSRLKLLVHFVLIIELARVLLRPFISRLRSLLCLLSEIRIVRILCIDTCCLRHHRSKVECGSRGFLHHIALLLAVGWHDETLEVRCRQLMINTTISRVLHGEHPLQIIHQFVQEVGRLVVALRDIHLDGIELRLVHLVGIKHDTNGKCRIHNVLVIVASIIPAPRRGNDRSCRTTFRCCRRMHFHLRVGMSQRTSELPCILGINRHTRTNQIERLDGCLRQLLQRLWLNRERSREFTRFHRVFSRFCQSRKIHHSTLFARPR